MADSYQGESVNTSTGKINHRREAAFILGFGEEKKRKKLQLYRLVTVELR